MNAFETTSPGAQDPLPRGRQLLSIILPAFNEQEVLPLTYERFTAMSERLRAMRLDYELLFINDGSTDRTPAMLDELALRDPRVRAVHLTRNFGHQAAITAGIELARGDVVAIMDCDLQDPPEVLPRFLQKWREGFQVIYAVRRNRKEWVGKRLAYWAFYRLMALTAEMDIPLDSGDFCVMDRRAVDLLNSLPERQRFVRGLRTWVGLRQAGLEYDRDVRAAGKPQYTFSKLLKLAADGLVSFSSAPLRMVTRMGLLCALASLLFLVWVVIDGIFHLTGFERGWPSLAALVLFVGAVQLVSLGIMGEYLGRIFAEVKGRPSFLIARVVEQPASPGRVLEIAPSTAQPPDSGAAGKSRIA